MAYPLQRLTYQYCLGKGIVIILRIIQMLATRCVVKIQILLMLQQTVHTV
jgi:hypothetical protein